MAQGPAVIALASGAPLFTIAVHHEEDGRVLVLEVGPEVAVPPRAPGQPPREHRSAAIAAMTQTCADVIAEAVRAHPQDWHVLQPIFPSDLPPEGSGAP